VQGNGDVSPPHSEHQRQELVSERYLVNLLALFPRHHRFGRFALNSMAASRRA
jgi:hypothetical protein